MTHDYLVPSLREWLTSKQKETRRGRAELLLVQRSADWTLNPSARNLPGLFEWLSILFFVPANSRRNPRQHRAVLKAAARYFGARLLIGAAAIGLLAGGVFEWSGATEAAKYVHSLATARIEDVPALTEKVQPYRRWADPRLRQMYNASDRDSPERLRAALALLPVDQSMARELSARLIHSEPHEFAVICDALQGVRDRTALMGRLWQFATDPQQAPGARFRAGAALAGLQESNGRVPEVIKWEQVAPLLAAELISSAEVDPASYDLWLRHVSPIRHELVPALGRIFRDKKHSSFERNLSASVLGAFVDDGDPLLAELGVDATPGQISRLLPKIKTKTLPVVQRLEQIVRAKSEGGSDEDEVDRREKTRRMRPHFCSN